VPDPILIVTALAVAALVSTVSGLIGAWPWRTPRAVQARVGSLVGQATGWLSGCWLLGVRPHWPLREDLDRLLGIVLPTVLVVELVSLLPKVPRWLVWLLRLIVAGGAARVLLHGSSYLSGSEGQGAWSSLQGGSILAILAVVLATVWVLFDLLARRAPGVSVWTCLAGTTAGAAITVMLSGYATGGQAGLPLAGALLGTIAAALMLPIASRGSNPVGVAIVGLFGLLVIGRFFGELSWLHATFLFLAPLLGWLPEAPPLRRLKPWVRGLVRVLAAGLVVTAVVVHAQRKFVEVFQGPANASPNEPNVQDYLDYGR
jgi:hypothetical protein